MTIYAVRIVVTIAIMVSILFSLSFFFRIDRKSRIGADIRRVGTTPVLIICGQEARCLFRLRNFSMITIKREGE